MAEFQGWAREAISDARRRDVIPVLVGGSALYLRAVLDEFEFPGHRRPHPGRSWSASWPRSAPAALHERLARARPGGCRDDPADQRAPDRAGARGDRADRPALPGQPARTSSMRSSRSCRSASTFPATCSTSGSRERVERMWRAGFVDEVRATRADGLRDGRTASRALGYRQVLDFLAGECTEEEARAGDDPADPAVRPPAGHLVQARSRGSAGFRMTPRTGWPRRSTPYDRGCELPLRQRPRHPQRLRAAAGLRRLDPRRPAPGWWPPCATGAAGSAPTACCGSSGPPTRRRGSWTTATPTARCRRCVATGSGSSPATSPSRVWSIRAGPVQIDSSRRRSRP